MPWFKVDDKMHDHPKARRAGTEAMGLWSLAGSWCADNVLTNVADGFVPVEVLPRWKPKRGRLSTLVAELIDSGLWTETTVDGHAGYLFNDWPDYQPSRADVLKDRAEKAERQRLWRERNASRNASTNALQDGLVTPAPNPTRPDPTRPLITSVSSKGGGNVPTTTPAPLNEFCEKHQPNGTDKPCHACRRARESLPQRQADAKQRKADATARKAATIAACPLCDDNGITHDEPARRCNHKGATA